MGDYRRFVLIERIEALHMLNSVAEGGGGRNRKSVK